MASSEQLINQFYSKTAHLIINSRCSVTKVRNNKWFNLTSPEHIKINHFVYLEILSNKTTIELYKLSFIKQHSEMNISTTYKHCVSFFRSLYSILRLMPAFSRKNLTYRINTSFEYPVNIQELHLGSVATALGVFSLHVYYTSHIPVADPLDKIQEDLLNSMGTTPPQIYKRSSLGRASKASTSSFSPPSPDMHKSPSSSSLHEQKHLKRAFNRVENYKRPSDKRLSLQTSVGSLPTQQMFTPPSLGIERTCHPNQPGISLTRQRSQLFESDNLPFTSSASSVNSSSMHSTSPTSPAASESGIFKMEENRPPMPSGAGGSTLPLAIPRVVRRDFLIFPSTYSAPSPLPSHFLFTPVGDGFGGIGSLGFQRPNRAKFGNSPPTASSTTHQHIPTLHNDTTLTEFITEARFQSDAASSGLSVVGPTRGIGQRKSMQQLAIEKYKIMRDSFVLEDAPGRAGVEESGDGEAVVGVVKSKSKGKRRLEDDEDLLFQMSELDLQ